MVRTIWDKFKEAIKKIASFLYMHKSKVFALILLLTAFLIGWLACKHFSPRIVEKTAEVPIEKRVEVPVEIPVAVKGDTVIQYVPKESTNDADVDIQQNPAQISMKYNDTLYRIDTLKDETQKFDKGKLEIQQNSQAILDVTPIVKREVEIALDEQSKQLNDDFHKELKTEKRKSIQKGFWTGVAVASGVAIGAKLAK